MKIEIIAIIVNIVCFLYYLFEGQEAGKIIYWLGAILLAVGLMKMRG